jgi:hypothetical protein
MGWGNPIWIMRYPRPDRFKPSHCKFIFWSSTWDFSRGGRGRDRSGDLTLFRRALYQLSYPTVTPQGGASGPDGI